MDGLIVENQIARQQLKEIWELAGGDSNALQHAQLPASDPILPTSFHLSTAAQTVIGAAALAAAEVWKHKTGKRQTISVDARHAAAEFRSERYFRINGSGAPSLWDPLAGIYSTGDGRFVRLHTNFPHHRENILRLLACEPARDAVQKALLKWKSFDFETAANSSGCVVAAIRSRNEWLEHPQARSIEKLPLISIEKIADAEPRPLTLPIAPGGRPLSGLRVLDLTRIVAGPVGARALAAYGADVMRIHSPHLPALEWLDRDTGRGKRSAWIDLNSKADREALKFLIQGSDVFMQAYRPRALSQKGFGPEELSSIKPGLIYVSLSAYGHVGPWAQNRGFDSLVQTATGFNFAEAEAMKLSGPKELPCQALDHASGYLMAFGAIMARLRQAQEGGSWHVRVSLAQTGNWIWSLGQSPESVKGRDLTYEDVSDLIETSASEYGEVSAIRHSAVFSETSARWEQPVTPLGASAPKWD
jgi:crotonobetainyl-CoA:carnitine CoA-transferase CaiB-like acyl-CoA transferase